MIHSHYEILIRPHGWHDIGWELLYLLHILISLNYVEFYPLKSVLRKTIVIGGVDSQHIINNLRLCPWLLSFTHTVNSIFLTSLHLGILSLFVLLLHKNKNCWASLVAQRLRICLPMQGTRVRALVWEDPACRGTTRPVSHNYWACASGACAPQRERLR